MGDALCAAQPDDFSEVIAVSMEGPACLPMAATEFTPTAVAPESSLILVDDVIVFGGVANPMGPDRRTSQRVRSQPDVDDLQIGRATRMAKMKEVQNSTASPQPIPPVTTAHLTYRAPHASPSPIPGTAHPSLHRELAAAALHRELAAAAVHRELAPAESARLRPDPLTYPARRPVSTMAGRSFAALFQDSQGADEEEDFFADGSQVGNYSPPIRAAAAPFRAPAAGGFSPRMGGLGAATRGLGAATRGLGAAPTFLDPPAPGGLDLNSEAAAFPTLSEYQHVLQPQEAPPRRRSGKHVVATAGRGRGAGRGAGGRGTSSSAGMPPRPARSGAGRDGGVVNRGRSLTNAASAQTGGHIDLDDDEEGFYCTNFNML
ncbi:hypothetical protein D1007_14941 [Hordeum vulgare]|nr:hypothetical protein D1007_14941 [Hordeum vulgare]